MPAAFFPADETSRLRSLQDLDVLDTEKEVAFDAIVEAAALVCNRPISLISLVDDERQWFKANIGLPGVAETPRDVAFCGYTILQDEILEVRDATKDARFLDNQLVRDTPNIRFYAGVPLKLSDGMKVGSLCVIDQKPGFLTDQQRIVLTKLAQAAVQALESRRAFYNEQELRRNLAENLTELEKSEAQFRALSDCSPLGIFSTDTNGACTYTNAQWQSIYGLDGLTSLGDGWSKTIHSSDRDLVFERWLSAARAGVAFDMQFRIVRSDGAERLVHSRAQAFRDHSGQPVGYVGSVEDISTQTAMREQLESERRRMADIIEGTGAGTWEWNVQTGETRFNRRWAKIIGYELEQISPSTIETWAKFSHPDDLERSNALLVEHFSGATASYECEARMQHRDGHWVWVLDRGRVLTWTADGKPEWMFGTHLDITDRKAQEAALKKSEALLERTGEVAGIGGWEMDLLTQELTWTSETRRIHGVTADYIPVLDKAIAFYAPEAQPIIQAAVQQSIDAGEGWDVELPIVRADGRRVWVRAVGRPEFEHDKPVRLIGAFQDISDRKELFDKLADQHELMNITLEAIGDAVVTTDADGIITWLNPVAEKMTGWPTVDAIGRDSSTVLRFVHEDKRTQARDPIKHCLSKGTVVALDSMTVLISRSGEEYAIEDSASPIRNRDGMIVGAVLVFHDVTQQRETSREMHYRATHDTLTKVLNRDEFETRLVAAIARMNHNDHQYAVLYIDLDQFKLVNDTSGHLAGDQFLREISGLISENLNSSDTLARLGGDEFGVILDRYSVEDCVAIAQLICNQIDQFRFSHGGKRLRSGASIGVVPICGEWTNASDVMQAADAACYAAKEAGRNRVHVWYDKSEVILAQREEKRWAARLEQALDENEFVLYAQKITAVRKEENVTNLEVLLRLPHSENGYIKPDLFLPAAERFQLATRIDLWVVARVIALLQTCDVLDALGFVSVNLSGGSVGDASFQEEILARLAEAGQHICAHICLEITETTALTKLQQVARFIKKLRLLKVRIALDDFGAGSSSFGYVKSLPIDMIKVDGTFIQNLLNDKLDETAVRCFVDVAKIVGAVTVAEFVNTAELLDRISVLGFDYAQGNLAHKPEKFENLLSEIAGTGIATTRNPNSPKQLMPRKYS